jgi:hypothetical protein
LYLEKSLGKKGLVEWLKVKALSSSPSTTINKVCNSPPDLEFIARVGVHREIFSQDTGKGRHYGARLQS